MFSGLYPCERRRIIHSKTTKFSGAEKFFVVFLSASIPSGYIILPYVKSTQIEQLTLSKCKVISSFIVSDCLNPIQARNSLRLSFVIICRVSFQFFNFESTLISGHF